MHSKLTVYVKTPVEDGEDMYVYTDPVSSDVSEGVLRVVTKKGNTYTHPVHNILFASAEIQPAR